MADEPVFDEGHPEAVPSAGVPRPFGSQVVERFMGMVTGSVSGQDQFINKLEPEQVNKLLDNAESESVREDLRQRRAMLYFFFAALTIPVFLLAICWLFLRYEKGDLLREIIALLVGLGGGGAGGFGLGRITARKAED